VFESDRSGILGLSVTVVGLPEWTGECEWGFPRAVSNLMTGDDRPLRAAFLSKGEMPFPLIESIEVSPSHISNSAFYRIMLTHIRHRMISSRNTVGEGSSSRLPKNMADHQPTYANFEQPYVGAGYLSRMSSARIHCRSKLTGSRVAPHQYCATNFCGPMDGSMDVRPSTIDIVQTVYSVSSPARFLDRLRLIDGSQPSC